MRHTPLLTAAALLVLMTTPARADQCTVKQPDPSHIDIAADASVDAAPDLAIISAGVITDAPTAQAANTKNREKMVGLFKALKDAGVADKDVQTSNFTLAPQYQHIENKPPRIASYQANNTVTVKLHDLTKIGGVLDAMIAVGGNNVNGPSFTIDDPESQMNVARAKAMKKAMDRARLYADASGMKVKRVISITEGGNYLEQATPMVRAMSAKMEMADAEFAAAPTPVSAGQMNLQANVNVSFELEPK